MDGWFGGFILWWKMFCFGRRSIQMFLTDLQTIP